MQDLSLCRVPGFLGVLRGFLTWAREQSSLQGGTTALLIGIDWGALCGGPSRSWSSTPIPLHGCTVCSCLCGKIPHPLTHKMYSKSAIMMSQFPTILVEKDFKWKNTVLVIYNILAHGCSRFIPWQQGDETGIIILILHMKNVSQCECQSTSPFCCSECSLKHYFPQRKTIPKFRIDLCKIQNANL